MSTLIATIPAQFILYIPTRSTGKDPFAQYLLINATPTPDGKATRLDPAPHVASFMPPYVIKKVHLNLPYTSPDIPVHSILLNINNNMPMGATFMKQFHQIVIPPDGGEPLIVLRLNNGRLTDLLPSHLKRNIPMSEEKPTVVTSPPVLTPVGGAGTTPASTSLLDVASQISQIMSSAEAAGILPPPSLSPPPATAAAAPAVPASAPKKVKKAAGAPRPLPIGDLNPHVAKQLLALARLRKEECPIIAEEFTDGNTAVMPCGHLFSRMGIKESFKKEPRKCPACRAAGNPTLV